MPNFTSPRLFLLPLTLSIAACGDSGSTTVSGTGTAGTETGSGTTASTTEAPPTTSATGTTDGSGSATQGMTTTGSPTSTSTSASTSTSTTGTTDGTTAGPQTSTDSTTTTGVGTSTGGSTTTNGVSTTGDSTTGADTTNGISSSSGGPGSTGSSTTGEPVPCMPGDGMNMGPIDKSYIYIPSQNLGDVAKVNTLTLIEEARYRTGPQGGTESPSRTAVSADGRFVVVNGRGTGRSTMFAANKDDCIDNNGNGVIDTSNGPGDVKAWGQDECMIWSITHPWGGGLQGGPRGITWTPGTWSFDECKYVDPKIWLGYRTAAANVSHIVRIDGLSGIVEETIVVNNWVGSSYAPYGGALDPDFNPWFTGLRGELIRVNADQNPATLTRITAPANIQAYGMTVDQDGNPWIGGCTGPVSTYDVQTAQWITVANTSACHRGIGAGEKYVWVASNGPCGLVQVDRKNRTLVAKHTPPQCGTPIGISIDIEKYLWLVDQSGWAWKIDQDAVAWNQKPLVNGSHYVYSDMTGGQVLSILPQ